MPKERFHLLLADQSLQILTALGNTSLLNEDQKVAFLLGAISPDALFYDLPSFRLSSLGTAFHQLEGRNCLAFLESIIKNPHVHLSPEATAWILGIASHFLVDGFWHPIIAKMNDPGTSCCRKFKLTETQCHHWWESELEAYWLARIGPADAFLPLLKHFARKNATRDNCLKGFRSVLMRMELDEVLDESRIERCLTWQALLLYQFSLPAWARWRNLLLRINATRLFGALIVPASPVIPSPAKSECDRSETWKELCDHELVARSTVFVANHLHSLSALL